MTKKNYQLIAGALRASKPKPAPEGAGYAAHCQWHFMVCQMADALQEENARFNRGMFLAACDAR